MGKRWWVGLLLASFVGAAWGGGGPAAVRKQVESSLLVMGTIDLDAQGRVAGYAIENQQALPDGILAMLARALPQWRFQPLMPAASDTAPAQTHMGLRIVARKMDNGDATVRIRGAQFGQYRPGDTVSIGKITLPSYPQMAAQSGVGGTVYMLVKIGRDGRVEDAAAEQVNLRVIASENDMGRWRDLLAKAALRAAKTWTFNPPSKGGQVDARYWAARIPFDFRVDGEPESSYGKWEVYVPGPRQTPSWVHADEIASSSPDAFPSGGVYPVGGGPRLLTVLDAR